jgi:hypothetical protein
MTRVVGVFEMILDGNKTKHELISLGKYGLKDDLITDDLRLFVVVPHDPVKRVIELVRFDHDPTNEEVLDEFKFFGLARPDYEDAFYFGFKYPREQRKHPVVFLHKPELICSDHWLTSRVLVLYGYDGFREIRTVALLSRKWTSSNVFAGVRSSTLV